MIPGPKILLICSLLCIFPPRALSSIISASSSALSFSTILWNVTYTGLWNFTGPSWKLHLAWCRRETACRGWPYRYSLDSLNHKYFCNIKTQQNYSILGLTDLLSNLWNVVATSAPSLPLFVLVTSACCFSPLLACQFYKAGAVFCSGTCHAQWSPGCILGHWALLVFRQKIQGNNII